MLDNYNTKNEVNDMIELWLINPYGEVYLNKTANFFSSDLNSSNLTLVNESLEELLIDVRSKWDIRSEFLLLEEIYQFDSLSNNNHVTGYVLVTNEVSNSLKSHLKNVSFYEIANVLNMDNKDEDLKESIYSLLGFLDTKYGVKVHDSLRV